MITDVQAQRIASDWHSGGGSPLYQFSSTGAIVPGLLAEIDANMRSDDDAGPNYRELAALKQYVSTIGERGPIADWYARVICS